MPGEQPQGDTLQNKENSQAQAAAKAEGKDSQTQTVPAPGPTQPVVVEGKPLGSQAAEPTKPYKLREGKKHIHDGMPLKAGDVVQLTKQQGLAFKDKFDAA